MFPFIYIFFVVLFHYYFDRRRSLYNKYSTLFAGIVAEEEEEVEKVYIQSTMMESRKLASKESLIKIWNGKVLFYFCVSFLYIFAKQFTLNLQHGGRMYKFTTTIKKINDTKLRK